MNVFIEALQASFALENVLFMLIGTLLGAIVGIIPGLGALVGIVIILPITFTLEPNVAISMLLGVYCACYYTGAIPAVLLRTPGTPQSLITCYDGFPLTQQGKPDLAMSACFTGSFVGGIISLLLLICIAPILAKAAASFGPPEFFAVALFGMCFVVMTGRTNMGLSVALAALGIFISTIGYDDATMFPRYCFGIDAIQRGIDLVPLAMGLFGVSQAMNLAGKKILPDGTSLSSAKRLDFSNIVKCFKYWKTMVFSAFSGTFVGLIPGTGALLGSLLAYEGSKRITSKEPERYGTGTPEGILASEAGNNATPAGALIPLLTLGIPGDVVSALLGVIFITNGIFPGPMLISSEPVLITGIYISLLFVNVVAFVILALWLRACIHVVRVPGDVLSVSITILAFLGVYAVNSSLNDIYITLFFSVLGYLFLRLKWQILPLILGVVLGNIIEVRLRNTLGLSDGDIFVLFTRPLSCFFMICTIMTIVIPFALGIHKKRKARKQARLNTGMI